MKHRRTLFCRVSLLIAAMLGCIPFVQGQCDGVCVALAKCKNSFGGMNTIDLRIGSEVEGECDHYLEVCCDHDEIIELPDGNFLEVEENDFDNCGYRNSGGVGLTITHAHNETQFGEFPWMVAILESEGLLKRDKSKFICGGSLVASNVVLTAAHCIIPKNKPKNVAYLTARAGEWDTRTENEIRPHQMHAQSVYSRGGRSHEDFPDVNAGHYILHNSDHNRRRIHKKEQQVKRIIIHPSFKQAGVLNDVALLVLKDSFLADKHIKLICLPPQGMQFSNDDCFATGWGKRTFNSDSYQVILKKVQLPMVPHQNCQKALRSTRLGPRFSLHDSFVCAGGQAGIDTCTGDGGSPLVCPVSGSNGQYYQAGIVAWGIGCGEKGVPGVYVKTSLFTDWINQEIQELNTDDFFDLQ